MGSTTYRPGRKVRAGSKAAASICVAAALIGLSASGVSAVPEVAEPDKIISGEKAIDRLGADILGASKAAHMSVAQLERTLKSDASLKVDSGNRLFYVDGAPADTGATSITDLVTTPVYPTADTFALHSRAAAPLKDLSRLQRAHHQWDIVEQQFHQQHRVYDAGI